MDEIKTSNRAEMIKFIEETLQEVKRWEWDGVIIIKQRGEHTKVRSDGMFHPDGVRSAMAGIEKGMNGGRKES